MTSVDEEVVENEEIVTPEAAEGEFEDVSEASDEEQVSEPVEIPTEYTARLPISYLEYSKNNLDGGTVSEDVIEKWKTQLKGDVESKNLQDFKGFFIIDNDVYDDDITNGEYELEFYTVTHNEEKKVVVIGIDVKFNEKGEEPDGDN